MISSDGINVKFLTGDSGGGGAIQYITPALMKMQIILEESEEANCTLHGMQKSIENASIKTMGDQGTGCRCPTQMLYVFAKLMRVIALC